MTYAYNSKYKVVIIVCCYLICNRNLKDTNHLYWPYMNNNCLPLKTSLNWLGLITCMLKALRPDEASERTSDSPDFIVILKKLVEAWHDWTLTCTLLMLSETRSEVLPFRKRCHVLYCPGWQYWLLVYDNWHCPHMFTYYSWFDIIITELWSHSQFQGTWFVLINNFSLHLDETNETEEGNHGCWNSWSDSSGCKLAIQFE